MPTTTWILVADGARARVFKHEGGRTGDGQLAPVPDGEMTGMAAGHQTRDLASDQPGQTRDRAAFGQRRMDPPTEPQRHAKHSFAKDVADMLADALNRGRYDRLVVCAPPQALGDLRRELSKQVQGRVAAEVKKDLTWKSDNELKAELREYIQL